MIDASQSIEGKMIIMINIAPIITELLESPFDAESLIIPIAEELTQIAHNTIDRAIYDELGNCDEYAFIRDILRNNNYNA